MTEPAKPPKPKPFNILLTAEQRAKLEEIRKAQGLRSEADAVRYLIDQAAKDDGGRFVAERAASIAQGARGVRRRVEAAREEIDPGARSSGARLNLQVGPTTRKPGDLMKKPKGK